MTYRGLVGRPFPSPKAMTRAAPYPRHGTSRTRSLPLIAALAMSGCSAWCYDDLPPSIDPAPPVSTVEIVPRPVWVAGNQKFTLRVRLKDVDGRLLPRSRAVNVVWKADAAGLSPSTPPPGEYAEFAATTTAPNSLTWVTAAVEGKSDSVDLIVAYAPTGGRDWIPGDHVPPETPRLAISAGSMLLGASLAPLNDSLRAFVQTGELGDFRASPNAGEVTVFSRDRQLTRVSMNWSDAADRVNVAFKPKVPVPVTIWVMDETTSLEEIDQDVEYAQRILDEAWAGIQLVVTKRALATFDVTTPVNCPPRGAPYSIQDQLEGTGVSSLRADTITVAYARDTWEVSDDPIPGPLGQTCIWNNADGVVVIVNATRRYGSTFAHELGHALGWLRHVEYGEGFDESNLLWFQPEPVPASRVRLTLGQAFRFTLDAANSFLRNAGLSSAPGYACLDFAPDPSCPPLSRDVRQQ
jgi:hypothetical protein